MNEPNEILKHEHREIIALLAAVDGIATRMVEKGEFPAEDCAKAFKVIVEFADKCHHGKEEKALFPVLAKASPETGAELARRLTSDHRAFRQLTTSMMGLTSRAGTDSKSRDLLAKNMSTYVRLVRVHINIEEDKLFSEVEKSLKAMELNDVTAEFRRIEKEEVGEGAHEKYLEIIRELEDVYAH